MEPLGEEIAALATAAKLPEPNEDETTTLTKEKTAALGIFLGVLLDYVNTQYERCGIQSP